MKEMEYYKSLSENILYRGICVYCFLLPFMQNPYKPIFGESLATGRLQPTDILLALLTPLGIYHLLFARKYKDLLQYKGVVLVLIVYLISIALAVDYSEGRGFFPLLASLLLAWLFILSLTLLNSRERVEHALLALLLGVIVTVVLSYIALFGDLVFGWKWEHMLSENHVFPYLGDVTRISGPLQPTTKLLSSYLTLSIGCIVAYFFTASEPKHRIYLGVLALMIVMLYPFTLSRGVVGFAFAISFCVFWVFKMRGWNLFIPVVGFIATTALFLVTFFASTIYIVKADTDYDFDRDVEAPHSVYYYFDPVKGKEKVSLDIEFAMDHYFWLKKASFLIFQNSPNGVGNSNFSSAVRVLEEQDLIPSGLSRHNTPQSEFFYAASERGWFGLLATVGLFASWILQAFFSLRKSPEATEFYRYICIGAIGSLIGLCFIDSLYLEISRFRFLWAFSAVIIIYTKYGCDVKQCNRVASPGRTI